MKSERITSPLTKLRQHPFLVWFYTNQNILVRHIRASKDIQYFLQLWRMNPNRISTKFIDYATKVIAIKGIETDLEIFRGDVLLIVNTANRCDYAPQYQGLKTLYKRWRGHGFSIRGFPCNQFGRQEPETEEVIATFCRRALCRHLYDVLEDQSKWPGHRPALPPTEKGPPESLRK